MRCHGASKPELTEIVSGMADDSQDEHERGQALEAGDQHSRQTKDMLDFKEETSIMAFVLPRLLGGQHTD